MASSLRTTSSARSRLRHKQPGVPEAWGDGRKSANVSFAEASTGAPLASLPKIRLRSFERMQYKGMLSSTDSERSLASLPPLAEDAAGEMDETPRELTPAFTASGPPEMHQDADAAPAEARAFVSHIHRPPSPKELSAGIDIVQLCQAEAVLFEQYAERFEPQLGMMALCISNPVRLG